MATSILAALVGACGGGPTTTIAPSSAASLLPPRQASQTTTTTPAASVTPSPIAASVTLDEPVYTFDGDARRVRVYRPQAMAAGKVPLLLFLHASGDTPAGAATETGFDRLAGTDGFIAVFPPSDSSGWAAQVTPGLSDSPVDERWLTKLLDRLLATEPIDPGRIFVAGFSKGAVMTERLACRLADRIAAAAIVGGAAWVGGACEPSDPVSVLFVHGTADSTLRISGARQVADQWRALDGCGAAPSPSPFGDAASVQSNDHCRAGTAVEFITVRDGSHAWFTTPDVTTLAWAFFTEHARP